MTDKKAAAFSFKLSRLDRVVDKIVAAEKGTMTKTGKKASSTGDVAAASKQPRVPMPGSEEAARSSSSRQIMENFLQGAATPSKRHIDTLSPSPAAQQQAAKRVQEDGDSSDGDPAEAEWQLEMRKEIIKEAGLTEDQVSKVMGIVMKAFKLRVTEEARKVARQAVGEDQDARKSGNSIIIHRADQWVAKEGGPMNLNLAEKVTIAVHRMTAGSVAVLDAFTLGRWDAASPPTAVLLTLGSRSQKVTFFKILARRAAQGDQDVRVISCRDAFPKRHLQAAKDLAKKGNDLRVGGSVASFRVVARGEGCVPILEVKGWEAEGRRESRWRVYMEEGLPQRDLRKRNEKRKPDTPRKPSGAGGRLSEAGRPREVIGGFPDAEDTVFLPQDEEDMDQHYAEDF